MVVLKNGLLLHGVFYTVLDLVRGLLRLEFYQTASVLPVFQQMDDEMCIRDRRNCLRKGRTPSGFFDRKLFDRNLFNRKLFG